MSIIRQSSFVAEHERPPARATPDMLARALARLRAETPWPVLWVTKPGSPYLAHRHPVEEQFLLLEGHLEFWDVKAGDYFDVRAGDELIIPKWRLHCVRRRQAATSMISALRTSSNTGSR
jgi:quercetin dioxygenase-like cupin family protein